MGNAEVLARRLFLELCFGVRWSAISELLAFFFRIAATYTLLAAAVSRDTLRSRLVY